MNIKISNIAQIINVNYLETDALHISPSKILVWGNENPSLSGPIYPKNYYGASASDDFSVGLEENAVVELLKNRKASLDLSEVSTIYIAPNSVVPRYRLKEIKDKYNITITRDSDKADLIIIGEESIKHLIDFMYVTRITKTKHLTETIYNKMSSNLHVLTYKDYNDLYKHLQNAQGKELPEYCYLSYAAYNVLNKLIGDLGLSSIFESDSSTRIVTVDTGDKLNNILNLFDKPFVIDRDFVATFGESIIDENSYEFINNLFKSGDDNVQIAMTMMANCNFDKSLGYLLLLFYEHESFIYQEHRKLVSYKSLYSFLNKNRSANLDSLIENLEKNNFLTDHIKGEIKEIYKRERGFTKKSSNRIVIKNIEIDIV
jgi:hypothetical protein